MTERLATTTSSSNALIVGLKKTPGGKWFEEIFDEEVARRVEEVEK